VACPVAGANHTSVDNATRRWKLSENGITVSVFGAIQHPAKESRSLAKRGLVSLGDQESAPLGSGEVLLNEWQDGALFVVEMITKGAAQVGEHGPGRHVG
jgi:hypothetical protein